MALFLLGAGGLAREIAHVIDNSEEIYFDQPEIIYLSDNPEEWGQERVKGKVIGSIDNQPDSSDIFFIPAVGSPKTKAFLAARALKKNWRPFPYIRHLQSFIGDAKIGDGSVICSFCSITTNVTIGQYVVVNLNCTIGHDAIIEDYVNLSPHCTISGKVHIKRGADLGSAVSVLPGVTVGENSIIGAGAVVNKDIPDNCLAVGVPAKVIKEL